MKGVNIVEAIDVTEAAKTRYTIEVRGERECPLLNVAVPFDKEWTIYKDNKAYVDSDDGLIALNHLFGDQYTEVEKWFISDFIGVYEYEEPYFKGITYPEYLEAHGCPTRFDNSEDMCKYLIGQYVHSEYLGAYLLDLLDGMYSHKLVDFAASHNYKVLQGNYCWLLETD